MLLLLFLGIFFNFTNCIVRQCLLNTKCSSIQFNSIWIDHCLYCCVIYLYKYIFFDPFTSKIQVPNQCKIKIWHPRILCMIHIPFSCLFLWLLVSNEECFLLLPLPLLFGWLPNTFRNICMKIAFLLFYFNRK